MLLNSMVDDFTQHYYKNFRLQHHRNFTENVSQIAFKSPTFYSKDIREIGAVIANTEIFIGADSGIMHLLVLP
jgi:ADP-heptose:LPS heptosyltransferase